MWRKLQLCVYYSYVRGTPQQHVGHNPAGALAILAMIAAVAITVATGYASEQEIGAAWLTEIHEAGASLLLGIVVLHIAAVLLTSVIQRENLVRAMLTGKKMIAPADAINYSWTSIGLLLLCALAGLWWFMFK